MIEKYPDLIFRPQGCRSVVQPLQRVLHLPKGFTLIEFVVVILIIVVMAGLFLVRIPYYQEQAEKTAMQQVRDAIQSALVMRYSVLMMRNVASDKELGLLATDNPITWLQKPPINYRGEYYDPGPRTVAPGSWMFDLKSRELIYVIDHGENFTPGVDGKKWIRFRVQLVYEPALGATGPSQALATTLFETTTPLRWFD